MTVHPDHRAVDPDDVTADEQLLEDLRAGAHPPTADQIGCLMATWRDEVNA